MATISSVNNSGFFSGITDFFRGIGSALSGLVDSIAKLFFGSKSSSTSTPIDPAKVTVGTDSADAAAARQAAKQTLPTTTPTQSSAAPQSSSKLASKKISKLESNLQLLQEKIEKEPINFVEVFSLIEKTIPLISSKDNKARSMLLELKSRLQNISKNISMDKVHTAYKELCRMMIEIPLLTTKEDFEKTYAAYVEYVLLVNKHKGQRGIAELDSMLEKFEYRLNEAQNAFKQKSAPINLRSSNDRGKLSSPRQSVRVSPSTTPNFYLEAKKLKADAEKVTSLDGLVKIKTKIRDLTSANQFAAGPLKLASQAVTTRRQQLAE